MFNLHTHTKSKNAIINIDDKTLINDDLFYSAGIHPWYNYFSINNIEQLIKTKSNIIAIGECGIDKLKSQYSISKQIELLTAQIKLSEQYQLPLILHIVKGFNEIIKLKKDLKPNQPWIIHGFNKYKQAKNLIDEGFYLSFGKALTINNKLQTVFKDLPNTHIFLETDDNAIEIEKIYTFASELKAIKTKQLIKDINKNLTTVFNGKLVRKT